MESVCECDRGPGTCGGVQDRSWLRPKSPSANITPGKPTSSAKHFGGRRRGGGETDTPDTTELPRSGKQRKTDKLKKKE